MWELINLVDDRSNSDYQAEFVDSGKPSLRVLIRLIEVSNGFAASSVEVSTQGDDSPVMTASRFRDVPLGQLVLEAQNRIVENRLLMRSLRESLAAQHATTSKLAALHEPFSELRDEWPYGDVERVAKAAAEIYTDALSRNEAPRKAVADAFGVSTATASRMIAKARDLDLLIAQSVGGRFRKIKEESNAPAETESRTDRRH